MTERMPPDSRLAALILETDLDAPPETVWKALTTPELVAQWLMANDIGSEPGHRFTLEGKPEDGGVIACEILESEPPRRLSYSWCLPEDATDETDRETIVTFELSDAPQGGTHLRLVHGGFAAPTGLPVAEPEILVYLPPRPVARRRLRKRAEPHFLRRQMPTVLCLAA